MKTKYPICRKLGLLRGLQSRRLAISTSALYEVLGNKVYQRATRAFRYVNASCPLPDGIEEFLANDHEAKQKVKGFLSAKAKARR